MRGMQVNRRWRRAVVVGVLAAFAPLAAGGCFGGFNLTRKVYHFNKKVDRDQWIQWFVFVIISVFPIYGFAMIVDLVIANSLEFWTGDNPIEMTCSGPRVVRAPDGSTATLTYLPGGRMSARLEAADGSVREVWFSHEDDSVVARDADGTLLARVTDVAGLPTVVEGSLR